MENLKVSRPPANNFLHSDSFVLSKNMSAAPTLLLLVVVLAIAGTVSSSNFDDMMGRYEGWKKCHTGFNGITSEQKEKFKKCDDMNIADHLCYLACIRVENKLVGPDGRWDDTKGYKSMSKMWDTTPAAQEAGDQWYRETRGCISTFETTHKWPMAYGGKCTEMKELVDCVRNVRKC